MKVMETNEWVLLNQIVYRIHSTEQETVMRKRFLEDIRLLIPFAQASFFLSSHDRNNVNRPVALDFAEGILERYLEFGEKIDSTRWIYMSPKSLVFRESDMLPDPVRKETPYYREFYRKMGVHTSLQISLAYQETFQGVVTLFRRERDPEFSEEELFVAEQVKDHLAYRLFKDAEAGMQLQKAGSPTMEAMREWLGLSRLTKREMELAQFLLEGDSNKEIAEKLCVTLHTVKKHTANLYSKLNINSRTQFFRQYQALELSGRSKEKIE